MEASFIDSWTDRAFDSSDAPAAIGLYSSDWMAGKLLLSMKKAGSEGNGSVTE